MDKMNSSWSKKGPSSSGKMTSNAGKRPVHDDESAPVKKRHRVAVVCINCKKRKIKCDKKKPQCENCIKWKSKCQYQDLVWASSTTVDEEGKISSFNEYSGEKVLVMSSDGLVPFKGKDPATSIEYPSKEKNHTDTKSDWTNLGLADDHPLMDSTERMDFFQGTMPTDDILRSGPFSWLIFALKDKFIKLMWLKASQSKQRQFLYLGNNLKEENSLKTLDEQNKSRMKHLKMKAVIPSYLPLPSAEIEALILSSLPPKRSLWVLLDRFYNYLYPYLSFVTWSELVDTVKQCLVTQENDLRDAPFTQVVLRDKTSLCHFAILFIVLRLGYLSFTEEVLDTSEIRQYVLNHPIGIDAAFTSQTLLNQFNYFDKPPLELLEGYIFLRWYHHYSPEQGDNTGILDSTVFNGIVMALSISLGLNRDPAKMEEFKNNVEVCNLRRRLWHFVVSFDIYQTASLGRPIGHLIPNRSVKYPLKIGTDPYYHENKLTNVMEEFAEGTDLFNSVASLLEDPHKVSVYEIAKGVKRIEDLKCLKYRSLADILNHRTDLQATPFNRLRKVIRLIKYVFFNSFCFTLEYNIFLHFENKLPANKALARYYLSRIISRSNETLKYMPQLITQNFNYFGYGLDSIQFPAILISMHKLLQVQTSMSLRCQHLLNLLRLEGQTMTDPVKAQENRSIMSYLKVIMKSISLQLQDYLQNLDHACEKYQYAWRLKRPHTLFWSISSQECFDIKDNKIVAVDMEDPEAANAIGDNVLEGMTLAELKELYPLTDEDILRFKNKQEPDENLAKSSPAAVSPSIKDERSPSISNLLNHRDHGNSSSSSSTFMKSPNTMQLKNVVDPLVDRNWIRLLYSEEQNSMTDQLSLSALIDHQQQQLQAQQNQTFQQQQPVQFPQPAADVNPLAHPQQGATAQMNINPHANAAPHGHHAHPIPVAQMNEQLMPQLVPQQTSQVPQAPSQVPQMPQHPFVNPANQSDGFARQPSNQVFNNNQVFHNSNAHLYQNFQPDLGPGFHTSESEHNLNEFFSLIGAGGFGSALDEMFGPVGFYDARK